MSADVTLSRGQRITAGAGLALLGTATALAGVTPVLAACMVTVTLLYAAGVGYKLLLVFKARGGDVLRFAELPGDDELPAYTVLVPLHREGRVVPALLRRLSALDYPADRLQILLLVEDDDEDTAAALPADLPPGFEIVMIPAGEPRTKPKACNVGLERARGDFCVIYDAEDRPEPAQLRKAVAALTGSPRWVVCVQAELHYWNPWTN